MNNKMNRRKALFAMMVMFAFLVSGLPLSAQDLVPVSDITGGSSIFVFRGSSRSATRKFVSQERSRRSKEQRAEGAKKLNRQYVTLAKITPRRARTTVVDPLNLPPQVKTMPPAQASKLFAGVGEYYIDKEDSSNAVDFFREAYGLDAKNSIARNGLSEALSLLGNDLLAKSKPDVAKKNFDEALKYNANNAVAYYGLAEMYSDADNDKEAIANYEKALSLDKALTEIYVPLGILYYQAGEIAKADNLLSKAAASAPEGAETQYFYGLVRFAQNNNVEALKAFRAAKSIDPKYAEAYYYTGETLVRNGKTQDAIREFQQAVALKPDYFEANFSLGTAYFEQENYSEAIKALKEAVRLKNSNIEAQANLADAYRLAGNYNDAESRYNLAATFIQRDKSFNSNESADVYNKIGYVIAKQCEINTKRAVRCGWQRATDALEKAVAISHSPVDYANLGWAYYNAAHNDIYEKKLDEGRVKLIKARDNLLKAVESNPNYLEGPLLNLGMTYTDLGDNQGAIDVLTRVVNKEPKWVFALNELGIAYLNNKNYKSASDQFRKAIDRDGNYAAAWYNLGRSEFSSGNVGESRKAYQKLKQLNRKDLADQLELFSRGAVLK